MNEKILYFTIYLFKVRGTKGEVYILLVEILHFLVQNPVLRTKFNVEANKSLNVM